MHRIIITPTFRPHFPFNKDFLSSLEQNAVDAAEVEVHFIVSAGELEELRSLLAGFPGLNVEAHSFEDLLERSGHRLDATTLLADVGKFAFQALKKLYALKVLTFDQALILDSESLILKPTRIGEAFDEYFADPFVFVSDLHHRRDHWYGELGDIVNQNAAKLLDVPYPKMHLLEYYGWFYEKRLVDALFAALPKDLLAAVGRLGKNKHIFECAIYYTFIYNSPDHYGYRFVSVNDLLREYLGAAAYDTYIGNFGNHWEQVGIFEYVSKEVTDANLPDLLRLFRDKQLRFYRSELVNHNERAQEALIQDSPITFLVSSENYRRIRERVAVCVSGHPRDYRMNLKHLADFLTNSSADVFFHFWESPDQDYTVRSLNPKGYEFESASAYASGRPTLDALGPRRREKFIPAERDDEAVRRFYSAWKANELKRAFEDKNDFTYDIVVSLTVDLLALDDLTTVIDRVRAQQQGFEHVLYVPKMANSAGISGHVSIGSSSTMDTVAEAFHDLSGFAQRDYFNPDYFLLRHVLDNGLAVQTFGFEYVPLTGDKPLTLETLHENLDRQLTHWSSMPLPNIPASLVTDFFRAKADSVFWVAELGLETPKVFTLRSVERGYVHVDAAAGTLEFTDDRDTASAFFLIVAGDADRAAINIRCRDLALAGDVGANLHPDRRGAILPNGSPGADAAFLLSRQGEHFRFEWRPGFWRTPASAEQYRDTGRLFLSGGPTGLTLQPAGSGQDVFDVDYIADATAEASPMGVRAEANTAPPDAKTALYTKVMWRLYTAARVFEGGGMAGLRTDTRVFMRKLAHRPEQKSRAGTIRKLFKRFVPKSRDNS